MLVTDEPVATPKYQDRAGIKAPPHAIEAEQSLLGGLMIDNDAWDRVAHGITEHDFYRPEHRLIYAKIVQLASRNTPFDAITMCDALESDGLLARAGGLAYLTEIANNTPSISNITAYADIVREKSVLRQLLQVSQHIADRVYHPEGMDSTALLDKAEQEVLSIAATGHAGDAGPTGVKDIMPTVVDKLDELMQSEGGITGTPTVFRDLDKMMAGLQESDMIIVAGRPSSGKTTLAMNIAENVSMESKGKPVLVFSLEMPKEALLMRMLSSLGRVDQSTLRKGDLSDQEWSRVFSTMSLITDQMNLYIDDTPAMSPAEMRSRARKLAREHGGLSLIVIDYIQLMQIPGGAENRTNEVSEISRSIKALAKELKVPVIAASQLSRKSEERTDKRPMMSDIRESGAIEQDADVIMFIYRDEVYNPDSEYKGTAEIIVGKHRNGPIGMVRMTFMGQYCRFDDYSAQAV